MDNHKKQKKPKHLPPISPHLIEEVNNLKERLARLEGKMEIVLEIMLKKR